MLVFCPHPLITAHPIDIHLGAFPPHPRLLQPPRLFTLRLFSNPPAYCHPPSIPDWRVGKFLFLQATRIPCNKGIPHEWDFPILLGRKYNNLASVLLTLECSYQTRIIESRTRWSALEAKTRQIVAK